MISISCAGQPRGDPKRTRRECRARLTSLNIPVGRGIGALCDHLSRERGRPIYRLPVPLQGGALYGCWISTAEADFIFYESTTSRLHQEHIIAHELAHMICRHRGYEVHDGSISQLFPDLSPTLVQDILQRVSYSSSQEHEAEIMAYLIFELAHGAGRSAGELAADTPGEASEMMTRIAQSLKTPM